MKTIILFSVILLFLAGCADDTNEHTVSLEELESAAGLTEVDNEYKENAIEVAAMLKTSYESAEIISGYELEKYMEFLNIKRVGDRSLTLPELTIKQRVINLCDFLTGEYSGDLTFDEEYKAFINDLD